MPGKKKPGPSVKDDQAASYDDWKVEDLRKRARELGLPGYSGKKKSDLVTMLRDH